MLDLRMPIGCLFLIIGTILLTWGCAHPVLTPCGGLQVNLNATWGSVMGTFGLLMSLLAWREKSRS